VLRERRPDQVHKQPRGDRLVDGRRVHEEKVFATPAVSSLGTQDVEIVREFNPPARIGTAVVRSP
jgi:hypothetical protein